MCFGEGVEGRWGEDKTSILQHLSCIYMYIHVQVHAWYLHRYMYIHVHVSSKYIHVHNDLSKPVVAVVETPCDLPGHNSWYMHCTCQVTYM